MGCQGKASNDSFKLLSGLPASSDMLVRIFLFLAPERWNSDIRNASDFSLAAVLCRTKVGNSKTPNPRFLFAKNLHIKLNRFSRNFSIEFHNLISISIVN